MFHQHSLALASSNALCQGAYFAAFLFESYYFFLSAIISWHLHYKWTYVNIGCCRDDLNCACLPCVCAWMCHCLSVGVLAYVYMQYNIHWTSSGNAVMFFLIYKCGCVFFSHTHNHHVQKAAENLITSTKYLTKNKRA